MKIQKRLIMLAIFISIVIWALMNGETSADSTPHYVIPRSNGTLEIVQLMCDEMLRMRDTAILEGRLRQEAASTCGRDTNPDCLPYYLQWSTLGELNSFLERMIEKNCRSH